MDATPSLIAKRAVEGGSAACAMTIIRLAKCVSASHSTTQLWCIEGSSGINVTEETTPECLAECALWRRQIFKLLF